MDLYVVVVFYRKEDDRRWIIGSGKHVAYVWYGTVVVSCDRGNQLVCVLLFFMSVEHLLCVAVIARSLESLK